MEAINAKTLLAHLEAFVDESPEPEPEVRARLVTASHRLSMKFESPWEKLIQVLWVHGPTAAALKLVTDVQLLDKLKEGPLELQELATQAQISPETLEGVMYTLQSLGLVQIEDNRSSLILTAKGREFLSDQSLTDALWYLYEVLWPVFLQLPATLARSSSQKEDTLSTWQQVKKTDKTLYSWLSENPSEGRKFHSVMAGYTRSKASWSLVYPRHEIVDGQVHTDKPLVVDIGGGNGEALKKIRAQFDGHLGSGLVLQDQRSVIESLTTRAMGPEITTMVHDLFDSQPVLGARYYTLGNILLNWPDDRAVSILRQLKPALEPGYSSILICEAILGDHPFAAPVSLSMTGLFNGRLRSRASWRQLAWQAGLVVKRFLSEPHVPECIIELIRS